jgi:hypothetical protein
VLLCSTSGAVAIGTPLEAQTVFGQYGCGQVHISGFGLLPSESTYGIIAPPRPINGCTYLGTGSFAIPAPPGGGYAVAARVRVAGASTGPMRIDVLRSTRSAAGFVCCTLAASSAVFTPTPNSITQVPVLLPMRSDLNATFGETVDNLALTVLGRNTVVPLSPAPGGAPPSLAWFPELIPSDAGANNTATPVVPLLNADVVACGGSPINGSISNLCTGLAFQVAARLPTLVQIGNGVALPATCVVSGPGSCTVVATIPLNVARGLGIASRANAERPRRIAVGTGRVNFTAAGKKTVRVRFTKTFRTMAKLRTAALSIRLAATARANGATSQQIKTVRLRVRR